MGMSDTHTLTVSLPTDIVDRIQTHAVARRLPFDAALSDLIAAGFAANLNGALKRAQGDTWEQYIARGEAFERGVALGEKLPR